ncbi:hypothetical protein SPONL_1936 [uncultured Candidatus Thioglobus sp.]|nr:hypothetical protein SPONL_1936 [uncultured Candidatus Thioglobus sp.]
MAAITSLRCIQDIICSPFPNLPPMPKRNAGIILPSAPPPAPKTMPNRIMQTRTLSASACLATCSQRWHKRWVNSSWASACSSSICLPCAP